MARIRGYRFTVASTFQFPLDMLRYDACYPASSESATTIHASLDHDSPKELRHVELISTVENPPTAGRWSSFLWTVVPNSVKPIR